MDKYKFSKDEKIENTVSYNNYVALQGKLEELREFMDSEHSFFFFADTPCETFLIELEAFDEAIHEARKEFDQKRIKL